MNKKYFIPAALIAAGIFFTCRSCTAQANEWDIDEHQFAYFNMEYRGGKHIYLPSQAQKKEWQEAYENHMFHAKRTYEDAKSRCWAIPRTNDRVKARYCFTTAIAIVGSSTPQAKLVAAVSTLLVQYGLDAMDEWNYIEEKLHWSSYHFDMCAHYQNLINNA